MTGFRVPGSSQPGSRDGRALDWLNFLLAGMGSTYGAFMPVYLTAHAWTQTRIGLLLTVGTVGSMICQVPAGLLVDALARRRPRLLVLAITAMGVTPLVFALLPKIGPVMGAMLVQAVAGSLLSPLVAATSLAMVGHAALGERLGRNGRYGAIGAGLGAAVMGVCGGWLAGRGIFLIGAALALPALLAARAIHIPRRATTEPVPLVKPEEQAAPWAPFALLRDRRLAVFALCLVLFQAASIAILQLAAVTITAQLGARGSAVIAACVIVPQVIVALFSPALGRAAERFGRRTVLLAGFATVPLRDALFALVRNPYALVPVQSLEGAGGAVFGVMMPLVAADLTRERGHYTLCLSLLGLASGLGTAASTTLAGWVADGFGRPFTYWVLAAVGMAAVVLLALAMPETRGTGENVNL